MKKSQLMKRYLVLILMVSFLLLWMNQHYNFPTKESTLSEVDPDVSWNDAAIDKISKEKLDGMHNDLEERLPSKSEDIDEEYEVTKRRKINHGKVEFSKKGVKNGSIVLHRENDKLQSNVSINASDSSKHNSKTLIAGTKTYVVEKVTRKIKKLINDEQDYGYKENAIFIAKLGDRNFVEVSKKAITKANLSDSIHRRSYSSRQNTKQPVRFESKQKQLPVETSHHQSVHSSELELDSFAKLPTLPDYDLPLLKKNDVAETEKPVFVWPPISYNISDLPSSQNVISGNSGEEDDVMTSAIVLGEINPKKMYSVFSTTTENREAVGFIFLLPLTTLAWKRIGFDSIIVIVGSVDVWNSNEMFHLVLSCVRELGAVVIFLEPRPEKSILISQVSRIFVANILRARAGFANRQHPDVIDDVYIVTTDADIWPLYGEVYRLPHNKRILSLNSECCGAFSHRGSSYKMLPMANIGMKIGTWRLLTHRFGQSPQSVDDILTCVVREFGPVALRPVHKGDNVGWFIDQMMASLLIATWTENYKNSSDMVKFVARDVGIDRIDRSWWNPGGGVTIEDKIDSHVLLNAHLPGVWVQLVPLIRAMYGDETDRYIWCMRYYDNFQKVFLSEYQKLDDNKR